MGSSCSTTVPPPKYSYVAATKWYLEGKARYGAAGFAEAAKSFLPDDIRPGSLRGRRVLITGANQGIGFSAAEACAKLGAEVHLLCRSEEKGAAAAAKINEMLAKMQQQQQEQQFFAKEDGERSAAPFPPRAVHHVVDVSNFKSVREFAEKFLATSLRADVIVNNAGAMPANLNKTCGDGTQEEITAGTLGGAVLLTGLLLPAMLRDREAEATAAPAASAAAAASSSSSRTGATPLLLSQVINVSSGGAFSVAPRVDDLNFEQVPATSYDATLYYAVAKRNMNILTEMFGQAFAGRCRFTAVNPGWVDTAAVASSMPEFYKNHKATLRTPEQGADTIVYLAANTTRAPFDKPGQWYLDRAAQPYDQSWAGTAVTSEQRERLLKNAVAFCGGNLPVFDALLAGKN